MAFVFVFIADSIRSALMLAVFFLYIDKNRYCTCMQNGIGGSTKAHRCCNDFISAANAPGKQRQMKGAVQLVMPTPCPA